MKNVLLALIAGLTIIQPSSAQTEQETMIKQLNTAAEAWYAGLEFDVDFVYRQSVVGNKTFEEVLKTECDDFLHGVRPSAVGFASKAPFFFRERFQIVGEPHLDKETGNSSWSSNEWGFFGPVKYRSIIDDQQDLDEGWKPIRRIYLGLKDGSSESLRPFSSFAFCGGGKPVINLPNVVEKVISISKNHENRVVVDVSFSVDERSKFEQRYSFRTDFDYPIMEVFESKTIVDGKCVMQSHSSIRSFKQLKSGPFPIEFVTVLGPLTSSDKEHSGFLLRVWKANKITDQVAESRYELLDAQNVPWMGLRPELKSNKPLDMKKWTVDLLGTPQPVESPPKNGGSPSPFEPQSGMSFKILKFLLGAVLFAIGVVIMRRSGRSL